MPVAMEGQPVHMRLPELRSARWPEKSHCVATGRAYATMSVEGVEDDPCRVMLVLKVSDAHYTPCLDATDEEVRAVHEINRELSASLAHQGTDAEMERARERDRRAPHAPGW